MRSGERRVVVVEDDPDIREDLGQLLRDEGYDVATAADGADGLRVLRAPGPRPCVVLLDLMMPVMDGWTMRAEMRADPSLRDIPVVILSGVDDVMREATALDAAGYLAKPFDLEALLAAVLTHSR